ncbi:histidine kinase [Marinomonas sp. CT5]|uniref:PDC sensor domain-containing protein n=1 Tax=Marinomonas sp. CT5 TaxID=2066133 RepID=UPI001BAFCB43|nr:PDC sensor domain-containing protein [Marinomonas sp. CT5]QUX97568.1 histidine kinase [Marinomonas sp. CT5]
MKNSHTLKTTIESVLCCAIFIALLGTTINLLYKKSIEALEEQIKIGLISSVSASASTLDGKLHASFDDQTTDADPSYQHAANQMERIREATPNIRYIYTCILRNGTVYFMVNPSPQNDADGDGIPDEPPALMTPYTDAPPELKTALEEHKIMTSSTPYKDQWGTFISGYSPFYDNQGEFIGVLAMDLELSHFYARLMPINRVFDKAKIIVVFLGLVFGLTVWWIRRSHLNHLNSSQEKEADTTKRLSHADELNNTLSGLIHYFYLQSPLTEPDNISNMALRIALYQYSQSLQPFTQKPVKQSVQSWFQTLNSATQSRCHSHHIWHFPLDTDALFSSEFFADELLTFHRQLSDLLQIPLIGETSLTEEGLDAWQLTTVFKTSTNQEEPTPEQSILEPELLEKLFSNTGNTLSHPAFIANNTVTEINLKTTINHLHNMGCQFSLNESGQICMLWRIIKEKAE